CRGLSGVPLAAGSSCTFSMYVMENVRLGRSAERQLDDLRRHRAVADNKRVAHARLPAHDRERDRPEHGRDDDRGDAPDLALAEPERLAGARRAGQPQPAQVAVRLAAPVQPSDRLLADVAALREADGAVVE